MWLEKKSFPRKDFENLNIIIKQNYIDVINTIVNLAVDREQYLEWSYVMNQAELIEERDTWKILVNAELNRKVS